MSILLNLPPETEAALIEQARAQGVGIDAYVQTLLEQTGANIADLGTHAIQTHPSLPDESSDAKAKFRAGIQELIQQARALDALHSPKENATEEFDPYMQALEEKFRKQGFRLR